MKVFGDKYLATYDIHSPYRPISLYHGHTDIVTCVVFSPKEDIVITSSLDSLVIIRNSKNYYDIDKICPKNPIVFDPLCNLSFKCYDSIIYRGIKSK